MRVFISYRRDDSMVTAALLYRELTSRPEFADAFMDIDDIGYGDDFVAAIDRALHDAEVVVVVIGPRWTEMLQARLRGDDWVRHEVATALRLREPGARPGRPALRVLPVLIGGATPPAPAALPPDLAPLAKLGMVTFDERALKASVNTLLEAVRGERFEDQIERIRDERRSRVASMAVAFALFVAALSGLLDLFGLDARVASLTMLLARVAAPEPPWSGQVVVVAIDDASERAIGREFGPSWRPQHAALIERAAAAGARTVAFDVVLEDQGSEADNAILERALAATRDTMPVIFGVQHLASDGRPAILARFASHARQGIACAGFALGQAYSMPLALQRAGAASAPSASANPTAAADDPQREATYLSSLALAAYGAGGRAEGIDRIRQTVDARLGPRGQRRTEEIRFYSGEQVDDPQECSIVQRGDFVASQLIDPHDLPPLKAAPQRIAYERVVAGDPAALALLSGRIVIVGATLQRGDRKPMPWTDEDRWGVELVAAQIDAMTRHVAIRRIHPLAEWALISALALLGAYCANRLRSRTRALRLGALTAIALVWVAASIAWYRTDRQLIGIPYGIAALALGAWLAHRTSRRPPA